jgi:hypothetical protein
MTKKKLIRQLALILFVNMLYMHLNAQHTTEFLFSETAPDYIRKTMQTNTKAMFAEINRAYDQNKSELALLSSNVTEEARKRVQTLWATSHFYCTETSITTRVLKSSNGYQVRNIPVFFVEGSKPEDQYQDIVIEFTESGKISDMYIAIAPLQYAKIMTNSNEVTDLRYRQMIVELVENFRTAYNRKDVSYLDDIYSNDALIITGKVLTPQKRGDVPEAYNQAQIQYSIQNKKQYLANLKRVFEKNSYINIKFDDIVVTRHEGNPNIYGITLKQDWNASGGYHDEGWLFLMIDYGDKDNPLIWVRTWQPLKDPNTGKDIRYSNEDIFGLGSFPVR